MNDYKSLNHTKWDCKFHVVWIPKLQKENPLRANKKTIDTGSQRTGSAEGKRNSRRTPCEGPRTYVHIDSTEVCCGTGDRIHKRQECYMDRTNVWSTEEFHRPEFLGQRVLCINNGIE